MSERHDNREWHGQPGRLSIALGVLAFITVFLLAIAASYGVTALIYRGTGTPPEFWRNIITGAGALLLLGAWFFIFRLFSRGHVRQYETMQNALTEALAQISRGNFNIALEPYVIEQHNELARAVSDMAKNLGNLETMRQDFVSNVSHEIQSPLTSIGGFAALLQSDELPAVQRKHYAEVIEAESRRLSSLSANLLKLSTLDGNKVPLNKHEFRLDRQLERVALTLEPQWSAKGLSVEADLQKCTLSGDEDLLSQMWVNLLHNAVKFTPDGGRIELSLVVDGETASVKIADTGVGIAPEDQVHVFERFFKVDKARDRSLGGNGLGLSLVKRIAELHGGEVAVQSEIGKGTAFEVRLVL